MFSGSVLTLMVSDFERSLKFYTETLGFKLTYRAQNFWAQLEGPGISIGLHPVEPGGPVAGQADGVSIGFYVQQIEPAKAELEAKGVKFEGEISEDSAVRLAHFRDPDGVLLTLCQMKWGG